MAGVYPGLDRVDIRFIRVGYVAILFFVEIIASDLEYAVGDVSNVRPYFPCLRYVPPGVHNKRTD